MNAADHRPNASAGPRAAVAGAPAAGADGVGVGAVAWRELRALWASPWDMALVSWWPLLLVAIVWWTFAGGLARGLPVVWVDHDRSATSRQLLQLLQASPTLNLDQHALDEGAAMRAVRGGAAVGWVVVPRDFERDIKAGRAPLLHLQVNGQQSTNAGMVKSQVQTVVTVFSAGVELKIRNAQGEPAAQALGNLEPLRPGMVTLFNGTMNYEAFLVPALATAILQLVAMFAGVACVGRELRHGTVPGWLAAAGGRVGVALAGKLLVNLVPLVLLSFGLVCGLAFWRGFTVQGSLPLLLAGHALALLANATLGVMAVLATRSLRMGLSLAGVVASPAFTYAGAGYPLMAMPVAAQFWAALLPLTHMLRLQAEQWGMGAPAAYATGDLAALLVLATLPWLVVPSLLRRCLGPDAWGRP